MIHCVREASPVDDEEVARRWWALAVRTRLTLDTGETMQLLFAGYTGRSTGQDVHDAIFSLCPSGVQQAGEQEDLYTVTTQLVGDVEFHLHASDWTEHQHHLDSRYNNVVLHVVLICDDP